MKKKIWAAFAFVLVGTVLLSLQHIQPKWEELPSAKWHPRDSADFMTYADRMWLLGGWKSSETASSRGIWSSDGGAWIKAGVTPWRHTDFAMATTYNGYMWVMGGWADGRLPTASASNAVWRSLNGATWEQVTPHAGWSPRVASGIVSFKGRLWILGGQEQYLKGDSSTLKNDVWSSSDGKEWRLETEHAPWSPRAFQSVVVHDGRIWLLGGGNYEPGYFVTNEVWSSADGKTWRNEGDAPWRPRIWFDAASYRGLIWVMGGWSDPTDNFGDVWVSRDGKSWHQTETPPWKARHAAFLWEFHDSLYLAGGHARPLSNEVWRLSVSRLYPIWIRILDWLS